MKKEFLNDLTAFVTEKAGKVSEKADQVIVIQGLHGQIRNAQREITKQYIELGKLVYEKYQSGVNIASDAVPHCEKIEQHYESIDTFNDTIWEYKSRTEESEDDFWDDQIFEETEMQEEESEQTAQEKVEVDEVIDEVIPSEDVEVEEKPAAQD